MANEDVAWVDVLPSMSKFMPGVDKALAAGMPGAGRRAGQQFGDAFGSSAANAVESASAKMSAARNKLADTTGQLRVAEARLEDLRQSGKATAAQIIAAEERVAKARRGVDSANESVTRSTRQVADAQTRAATASRTAGDGMSHAASQGNVFRRSWTGLAGLAIGVSAGIATMGGAFRFVGDAINKARDLNETINKSNTIFGANAGVINEWAKGSARSVGLSRQAALETAAQFGNMYTQLGFTSRAAADMSTKTVQMAADLGSFNNMPTADVAERIAAGFRGEYDSLQQLIPNISAARVESEAMAMTGKKNADSLTAQEKATAVLSIVQKDGSKAMGDFARTSGGLANQQKILSAEWDNAKAKLGGLLVGPMTAIVHWTSSTLLPVLGGAWHEITGAFTAFAAAWRYNDGEITSSGLPGLFERLGFYARQAFDVLNGRIIPAVKATAGFFLDNQWALGLLVGAYGAWRLAQLASTAALVVGNAVTFATTASTYGLSYALTAGGTASRIYAAGQWLANAAVLGFPLIWVVAAFAAVGAGLVLLWRNSETFRSVVTGVWDAVKAGISNAWEGWIKPAFSALQVAWGVVSSAIRTGYESYIRPAWAAVVSTAQSMWAQLQPVFRFLGQVWSDIVSGMKAVWEAVLRPAWAAIVVVAKSLWENTLRPVFASISTAWSIALKIMKDVWDNVLHPMWDLVWAVAKALWQVALGPIFSAIQLGWKIMVFAIRTWWNLIGAPLFSLVGSVIKILWLTIIQPIFKLIGATWSGLMSAMRWTYDHVVHPMWGILGGAIKGVRGVFEGAVQGIKTVWDGLKKIAAAPINFIVRTVLRDGLFTAWNWVLDQLGVKSWHVNTKARWLQGIPGYAAGGMIGGHSPSPTADNIPIWATAGEFMVRHPVAQETTPYLTALNAGDPAAMAMAQQWGRYANGGLIALGKRFQSMGARVSENSAFGGVTPGAHVKGSQHYLDNAIDVNTRPGTSALEQRELRPMEALAKSLGFHTIFMAPGHYNHLHVDGRGNGGSAGAAIADPWYVKLWHSVTGAKDWLTSKIGAIAQMGARFGNSPLVGWLKEMPPKLIGGMWDKIKGTVGGFFSALTGGSGFGNISDKSAIKLAVKSTATQYGFNGGAQWSALDWIINHESGWNPKAQNPTSTASGLFQHIDGTWRAYRPAGVAAAHMKDAGIGDQARAGMNYIRSRYGSPVNAQAFWQAHHWYANGGPILPVFHAGGTTRGWRSEAPAMLAPDERVFSRPQDDYFRRFVDATSSSAVGRGGDRMLAKELHVHAGDRDQAGELVDRLMHQVKVLDRGGAFAFEED